MLMLTFNQSRYQPGLRGIGANIYEVVMYIYDPIDEMRPKNVDSLSNLMGGFAAILLSTMLGIGETIAFSPQAFISPLDTDG